MPLYFAYGSCMNFRDFERTGVPFEFVDTAKLLHHRLAFTKYSYGRRGGVADIVPALGDYVEGILYRIKDFRALDAREGAPHVYRRTRVKVWPHRGQKPIWVWTYKVVHKSNIEFQPTDDYANLIREGARYLSPAYQLKLNKILKQKRFYYQDYLKLG